MSKPLELLIADVVESDACSGCGGCTLLDAGLTMGLDAAGYARPRYDAPSQPAPGASVVRALAAEGVVAEPIILSFFCAGTPSQLATDALATELIRDQPVADLWYRGRGWPATTGSRTRTATRSSTRARASARSSPAPRAASNSRGRRSQTARSSRKS